MVGWRVFWLMILRGPCPGWRVFAAGSPAGPAVLKGIRLRLLEPDERGESDRRLEPYHYLHQPVLHGPALRYVAELDGQWVALLAFGVASFHLKAPARRPGFVVDNARFLVLPDRG